jgi:hypothetical protein
LRGVATSLGISYNTLSSDLEGVNYSSIRAGLLDEREVWKGLQRYLIEHFCEPLFSAWLEVELLTGRLGLPFEKKWKFDVPEFQGRRWSWVDPKKDMEAAILAVRSGQTSLRKIASDSGQDIYDIARSIAADNELFASMGVTLPELTDDSTGSQTIELGEESGTVEIKDGKKKSSKPSANASDIAAASGEIQSTGMNGAQVTSLIDLAAQVSAGLIPISSAKAIASAAFPLIPQSEIDKIFDGMKGFKPVVKPPPTIDTAK